MFALIILFYTNNQNAVSIEKISRKSENHYWNGAGLFNYTATTMFLLISLPHRKNKEKKGRKCLYDDKFFAFCLVHYITALSLCEFFRIISSVHHHHQNLVTIGNLQLNPHSFHMQSMLECTCPLGIPVLSTARKENNY